MARRRRIRVFAIPAGTSDSVSVNATVFESITQTDAAGRYRLAIPPGRYYIGAGSVSSPTYYPNTTNISSARAIVVSADRALDNINFSQYVNAASGNLSAANAFAALGAITPLPPGSTGVVSGIIRTFDGCSGCWYTGCLDSIFDVDEYRSPERSPPIGAISGQPAQRKLRSPSLATSSAADLRSEFTPTAMADIDSKMFRRTLHHILAGYSDSPRHLSRNQRHGKGAIHHDHPTTVLDTLDFNAFPSVSKYIGLKGKVLGIGSRPPGEPS
jgi:hypothetical protein